MGEQSRPDIQESVQSIADELTHALNTGDGTRIADVLDDIAGTLTSMDAYLGFIATALQRLSGIDGDPREHRRKERS